MLKNILALATLGILLSCSAAPAFAKGYSGGGRSYSRPAYSRNVTVNKTVIVHHDNSGGAGTGLLTGMIVGHMLSQPVVAQPVVVQQQPTVVPQVVQPQIVEQPQVIVHKEEQNDSMLAPFLAFIGALGVAGFILVLHKSNKDKHNA